MSIFREKIERMMEKRKVLLGLFLFLVASFPLQLPLVHGDERSLHVLPEGRDFATQILRDPWDMSEYSDISRYMNGDGEAINLADITVQDGTFSARSLVSDNWFYLLFAGYQTALMVGKIGHNYPIQSTEYHCISIAMTANTSGSRKMSVWWSDDEILSTGQWGVSAYYDVTPYWKLYQIDLSTSFDAGTRWNDRATWQNLYIRPFLQAGVTFSVDWARLTDCNPVYQTITWSGSNPVSIYLQPINTNREIEIITGVTGNNYNLDVQGIAPGDYIVRVKQGNTVLASSNIKINQAPIAHFTRPSYTSGQDYASSVGNPWDMDSPGDVDRIECTSANFAGNMLELTTASPPQQPSGCNLNNISDARIWLPYPVPVDTNQYRYLTFRMHTGEPWADVSRAMVARWVWTINNDACGMVSHDIPYDVGWQTITIDLGSPSYGIAEDWTGTCPSPPLYWYANTAKRLRFDPNENMLSHSLIQKIDYIYLTQMDSVRAGSIFPVQVSFNKSASEITSAVYYYTDTLSQPLQHLAQSNPPRAQGNRLIYLPMITGGGIGSQASETAFMWNTAGVPPGTYYLCGVFSDGLNSALYCSEAPLKLTP
jgi:hypothetical protein